MSTPMVHANGHPAELDVSSDRISISRAPCAVLSRSCLAVCVSRREPRRVDSSRTGSPACSTRRPRPVRLGHRTSLRPPGRLRMAAITRPRPRRSAAAHVRSRSPRAESRAQAERGAVQAQAAPADGVRRRSSDCGPNARPRNSPRSRTCRWTTGPSPRRMASSASCPDSSNASTMRPRASVGD